MNWNVLAGLLIPFAGTALGSAGVFFMKKEMGNKVQKALTGFASGVMVAASIWSLIIPAMDQSEGMGKLSFVPAAVGFIVGGLFLVLLDKVIPHFHSGIEQDEGPSTKLKKPIKMFFAITIHNIPEGLAVGFAFGAAAVVGTQAAMISALGLAIGIAVQNFPEGAAVSLPLKRATGSSVKSFLFGMGSGAVEPVAAIIGYFLAAYLTVAQPWLLAFAAGAMIFVVA